MDIVAAGPMKIIMVFLIIPHVTQMRNTVTLSWRETSTQEPVWDVT
jgi:hypothetical protein